MLEWTTSKKIMIKLVILGASSKCFTSLMLGWIWTWSEEPKINVSYLVLKVKNKKILLHYFTDHLFYKITKTEQINIIVSSYKSYPFWYKSFRFFQFEQEKIMIHKSFFILNTSINTQDKEKWKIFVGCLK